MQALGDDDKADIRKTIDKDVLKKKDISFARPASPPTATASRSAATSRWAARASRSTFTLTGDGGSINGSATVKQNDWGIKPYSALFGALKVNDEVTVEVEGSVGVRTAKPAPSGASVSGSRRESGEAVPLFARARHLAGRTGAGTVILRALSSGRFCDRAYPGKERDCAGIGTIRVLLSERR